MNVQRGDMRITSLFAGAVFIILYFTIAQAEEHQKDWVSAVTPAENTEGISKKPEVKVEFLEAINLSALVVILDGTDITQLLITTEKGFEYKPLMVMPSGMHNLSIAAADKEGRQLEKNISFTTRHSSAFEEAYTSNVASLTYDTAIAKPDTAVSIPDSRVEGNLRSDTKIKGKGWQFTFDTNLRFLDQSAPVFPPEKKGIDAANWIFTGTYLKDKLRFKASIGDIQVNETPYTIFNLARKGGVFNLEYDIYQLNVFSVRSRQAFGLRGIGIEGTTDDHILGVSGGVKLFDKKLEFKTIYITGGEPGNSLGISTTGEPKKGDVLEFVMTSDFFENKMRTELGLDFSKFDPDTTDEFKNKSDKAYRLKVGGFLDRYNYEAMYEYIGRDYAVVGNQMQQKDKEGLSVRGGAGFDVHSINLMLSRYNDNVRGDELFPRIVNYQGNLDYSFNKIPNLPIGIGYQKSIQDSTKEPQGSSPTSLYTDTITGMVNYAMDKINIGFQTAYSLMDDRAEANSDTTTITYTLMPTYNTHELSVNPNFSLNQSKSHLTGVRTDTYTINLDLRTKFFREKASFDVGGTCIIAKADDGSANTRNLNAKFRLSYSLKEYLKGILNPSIALRGTYMNITDKINHGSNRDVFTLFLVLATSMPFSF